MIKIYGIDFSDGNCLVNGKLLASFKKIKWINHDAAWK
jgi:hypothetical protein